MWKKEKENAALQKCIVCLRHKPLHWRAHSTAAKKLSKYYVLPSGKGFQGLWHYDGMLLLSQTDNTITVSRTITLGIPPYTFCNTEMNWKKTVRQVCEVFERTSKNNLLIPVYLEFKLIPDPVSMNQPSGHFMVNSWVGQGLREEMKGRM